MEIVSGVPGALGASWDGDGVQFCLYSAHAEKVELCLFDAANEREALRLELPGRMGNIFHGYVAGLSPGQLYGFRVYGPYAPEEGHRFNPYKLLLDPYAKAVCRPCDWHNSFFGSDSEELSSKLIPMREDDSAQYAPKGIVVDQRFDWQEDSSPKHPYPQTVIYETHLRGLSMTHPEVPPEIRGTYLGAASDPVIDHLKRLGITSIEFLPVHAKFHEHHLTERNLRNYWGYNTLSYFAPEPGYACKQDSLGAVYEFKLMVRKLHAAGIEVIIDVVYNHTAEGNHLGPTLSFKGVDNHTYYRLRQEEQLYEDFTGCGNTLDTRQKPVVGLILDSLHYWVNEMHVDGFRFDLAAALGRTASGIDLEKGLFAAIAEDPTLSKVKCIAEPWDIGVGGYQLGNFAKPWTEWNGRYRDDVRDFWRGNGQGISGIATRIAGSSDLFFGRGSPATSINFITCHDGFTLRDLVSYNEKHNLANGEENRDGNPQNRSWNCGIEGETKDEQINELRARQQRNFLTTLFLSAGVPMLLAGDELGRSQGGNNNGYCHDSELTWLDWDLHNEDNSLTTLIAELIRFRREEEVFSPERFYQGALQANGLKDLAWFSADGAEVKESDWNDGSKVVLAALFASAQVSGLGSILALFNAGGRAEKFRFPELNQIHYWNLVFDSVNAEFSREKIVYKSKSKAGYMLTPHSVALFRLV